MNHLITLSPGEDGVEMAAPFTLALPPQPADVVKFDGAAHDLSAPAYPEQVASDLTGFTSGGRQ